MQYEKVKNVSYDVMQFVVARIKEGEKKDDTFVKFPCRVQ
jgi:hypothetical protein